MRPTDGRAITNPENAQSFSHGEIKQAADRMNPDALSGALAAWSAIAAAVTTAGKTFESALQNAVDQRWEGAAAVRSIREFTARVAELGESLGGQSEPLTAASSAASRFKAAIPEVPTGTGGSGSPEARNAAEEQARDDMVTYYIRPYAATAPAIPTLPPPTRPASTAPVGGGVPQVGALPGVHVDEQTRPSEQTAPGDYLIGGTAQTGAHSVPAETTGEAVASGKESNVAGGGADHAAGAQSTGGSGEHGTGETGQSTGPQTTGDQSTGQTPGSGAPTAAQQAAAPVTPTTPASYTSSPASSYTSHTTGPAPAGQVPAALAPAAAAAPSAVPVRSDVPASASGNATNPPNSAGSPRPGASVPAHPATQSAPPPATSAPARAGIPTSSGYAGMVPPRTRTRREEDGEHDGAKYLRTEEHAAELIGEIPKTVPPSIGAQ